MLIKSVNNHNLINSQNKQNIIFTSINTEQDSVSGPMNSSQNKEDDKKKAYWKGLITGVVICILASAGDRLGEYLIKKNSPKIK